MKHLSYNDNETTASIRSFLKHGSAVVKASAGKITLSEQDNLSTLLFIRGMNHGG